MKLVVHVGPHKTGTTALQLMLARNRNALGNAGICYPSSMTQHAGHHELSWSLKGWNLRLLGTYDGPESTTEILTTFMSEAKKAGASTLVLSSEDLSLLTIDEWDEFFSMTYDISAALNVVIDEVCVTWSRRSVPSSAQSIYSTLVLLGMTYDFASVDRHLREHFRNVLKRFARLRAPKEFRLRRIRVKWRRKGFVEHWLRRVLPDIDATQLTFDEDPVNVSNTLAVSEELALDNITRNVIFDKHDLVAWATYHDENTVMIQGEARERFLTKLMVRE